MSDYRTTPGEDPPLSEKDKRRRRKKILFWTAAGILLLLGALLLVRIERYVAASGYVTTAEYAEVRPAEAGPVAEILAFTGDRVEKGQVLVRMEDAMTRAQWEEARTRVRLAEAERARREVDIAERKRILAEQTTEAQWRLDHARARLERTRELVARGLVAGSLLEEREVEQRLAEARLASLNASDPAVFDRELAILQRHVEARREEEAAALARVETRLVRAPLSGRVLRYEFVPGELVRPDNILYEIFGGPVNVLKLRVAERHALRVTPGLPCSARLEPFNRLLRRVTFRGEVQALRDVIQSQGGRTYRVVYCRFDDDGREIPPGTSAEARIYVGRASLLSFLLGLD